MRYFIQRVMSVHSIPALLIVNILFSISACKKDSTSDNGNILPATLSCKVNGIDWKSDPASKEVFFWGRTRPSLKVELYDKALFMLAIRSTPADTQAINIEFRPTVDYVGVYHLYGSQAYDEGYFYPKNDMTANMVSDFAQFTTIEITRYDGASKRISGTFEIKMKRRYTPFDTVSVTEGVFENALIEN